MVLHITNATELQGIDDDLTEDYVLDNDIDMTDVEFTAIGRTSETPFTGTFDGQNFTIDNLSIIVGENEDEVGLFYKTENSTIKNLNLTNINISARGKMGGLIGSATNTTITNCHITGDILINSSTHGVGLSASDIGGLLGYGEVVDISYSSTDVNITAAEGIDSITQLGGFVGYVRYAGTEVKYCAANGEVHGYSAIGGFAGWGKEATYFSDCWSGVKVVIDIDSESPGAAPGRESGGFFGALYTNSLVERCFAIGPYENEFELDTEVGGFVGYNGASSSNGCFFDKETVGLDHDTQSPTSSPLGFPRTTTQMKTKSNFSAPWLPWAYDFGDTWYMQEGISYPVLRINPLFGSSLVYEIARSNKINVEVSR